MLSSLMLLDTTARTETILLYTPLCTILCFAVWALYTRVLHPLSDIPGPFWASFSRYWLGYQVYTGKAEYVQRELHEKYGPLVRIAPDEVSVSDPSSVKIIYGIKSGFSKTDFYPPFAPAISRHGDYFTQQNEKQHAARRKLVNNIYSMSSVLESEQYIDDCSDVFLRKMARFAEAGQAIDLGEWIQWYTFDVVGELFFGQRFGFMEDEHDFGNYIHILDSLLPGIALSCVLPVGLRALQPLIGLLVSSIRESVRGFDKIRQAGRFWVTHRMQQMEDQKVTRVDMLDKFFKVRQSRADFDIPEIQNEACVAIFAGSDTTAIAIRSILYYLMRTPVAYERLMEEIDKADHEGRLSRPHIKYNEAMSLPYLVACCKEGMRMHPSVGLSLPRYVPGDGRMIAGRFFPAKTKVGVNAAVLHLDQAIFGSDAATYNPGRWFRDPGTVAEMDRHMLQFGAGSRTCIGKNISLAEMHKLIPQLLRSYHLAPANPGKPWDTHNFWFNKQTGIKAHITARQA